MFLCLQNRQWQRANLYFSMGILANILIFNVNRNYNIPPPVVLLDISRTGYVRDYVFSSDIRAFCRIELLTDGTITGAHSALTIKAWW